MRWILSVFALVLVSNGCTYTAFEEVQCDSTSDCPDDATCRSGFCVGDPPSTNNSAAVARIDVSPATASITLEATQQFVAAAFDATGNMVPDVVFSWSTSDEQIATVVDGLATGVGLGTADITASADGVSAGAQLTVANPLNSIELTSETLEIGLGTRSTLSARALDARGNELNKTITWSSSDNTVATVDSSGSIFGAGIGMTTIVAEADGVTASATVRVVEYAIVALQIAPDTERLRQGETLALRAVLTDEHGNEVVGRSVDWSLDTNAFGALSLSPEPGIAVFQASESQVGTVTVTATFGELTAQAMIEVYRPEVAAVMVDPMSQTEKVGAQVAMSATVLDADDHIITGRTVTWSVDSDDIATIDSNGLLRTLAPGTVTVTATVETVTGTATVTAAGFDLEKISAGVEHTCGITPTGYAFCWGKGANGRLGTGSTTDRPLPTAVGTQPTAMVDMNLTFDEIHAGNLHTCARTGGEIYCWGNQKKGRLGNGLVNEATVSSPTLVTGGHMFQKFSTSYDHTCAIDDVNDIYCWGDNGKGRLGDGTTIDSGTPVKITPPTDNMAAKWLDVAAGEDHTCAVTMAQKLYCWGHGDAGELGNGATDDSTTPVAVTTDLGVVFSDVEAGGHYTCALSSGTLYCWGQNQEGQLGIGSDDTSRKTPVVIPSLTFTAFDLGAQHACGVVGNQGYCWGSGANGRLGNGMSAVNQPTVVSNGPAFGIMTAGNHTCGIASNSAFCWGDNSSGQLGDGTTDERTMPTMVYP